MTFEERQQSERVKDAMKHWPTLTEAFGCMDCQRLFRRAEDHCCPLCGSKSVLSVADYFNKIGADSRQESGDVTAPDNDDITDEGGSQTKTTL